MLRDIAALTHMIGIIHSMVITFNGHKIEVNVEEVKIDGIIMADRNALIDTVGQCILDSKVPHEEILKGLK